LELSAPDDHSIEIKSSQTEDPRGKSLVKKAGFGDEQIIVVLEQAESGGGVTGYGRTKTSDIGQTYLPAKVIGDIGCAPPYAALDEGHRHVLANLGGKIPSLSLRVRSGAGSGDLFVADDVHKSRFRLYISGVCLRKSRA
jgi:hypothetical protein